MYYIMKILEKNSDWVQNIKDNIYFFHYITAHRLQDTQLVTKVWDIRWNIGWYSKITRKECKQFKNWIYENNHPELKGAM